MALAQQHVEKTHHTEAEYFEFERTAFGRWEYVNGEKRQIAGGKDDHNAISMNVGQALGNMLAIRDCCVYGSDMKIHTGDGVNTFPDVAIVFGERQYYLGKDVILDPLLVVEVLSQSTKGYDRGDELDHCKSTEALEEYLLVDQDESRVILHTWRDDHWELREARGMDNSVCLSSVEDSLAMTDIYAKIEFKPEQS